MAVKSETGAKGAEIVKMKYIKFNHKKGQCSEDALDIRMNYGNKVEVPEWQSEGSAKDLGGKDAALQKASTPNYPAAYSIKNIEGKTITIKVFFECKKKLRSVKIRAGGGGILGGIKEQTITLNQENIIKLEQQKIAGRGITKEKATWNWEFSIDGKEWQKLPSTSHVIYVVLDIPKSPWNLKEELKKPWADVLELACSWASGQKDLNNAFNAIKRNLWNLLDQNHFFYVVGDKASYVKGNTFNCSQFLKDLYKVKRNINRFDCLAIVTALANSLGYESKGLEKLILWERSDLSHYVTRARWKPNPINTGKGIDDYVIIDKDPKDYYDTIAFHSTDRSQSEGIKALQTFHQEERKWSDLGYHFVINGSGTIYEGREIHIKGCHVAGANTGKIGISMMGNFQDKGFFRNLVDDELTSPTTQQMLSLKQLVRVVDCNYWIDKAGGHRDFDSSRQCPGDNAYPILVRHQLINLAESKEKDTLTDGYSLK
ncbi:MAG: N-acetylmuramoyl-L-alanine amidase [Clostridia bacterium]|nr:N-acetylmuramoyl-L-alanine amidase [Clostridia bacterium]